MGKFIDLTGGKFGDLIVLQRAENKNKQTMWLCKCKCGNVVEVSGGNLKSNHTKSCGCYAIKKSSKRMKENNPSYKHGLFHTRLYNIFDAMKKRCYLKTHIHYKNYGGRGIKICDEWLNKENGFINFYNWAIENGYQDDLTIDRIDSDKNYCPENCRWATYKEQQNNKRNNHIIEYNGEKHTLSQWAEKMKINYGTLLSRIYLGWNIEEALNTPVKIRRKK